MLAKSKNIGFRVLPTAIKPYPAQQGVIC